MVVHRTMAMAMAMASLGWEQPKGAQQVRFQGRANRLPTPVCGQTCEQCVQLWQRMAPDATGILLATKLPTTLRTAANIIWPTDGRHTLLNAPQHPLRPWLAAAGWIWLDMASWPSWQPPGNHRPGRRTGPNPATGTRLAG